MLGSDALTSNDEHPRTFVVPTWKTSITVKSGRSWITARGRDMDSMLTYARPQDDGLARVLDGPIA